MNDRFGRLIKTGDEVAFNPPRYKGLAVGVVTKFTPKMVEVEFERWAGKPDSKTTTKVFPWDVVKRNATQIVERHIGTPAEQFAGLPT